ncbi:MAG: T9SS type A sorting domain-containing protein [Bacteroidetes bacterium]|nr:T9SS type A sorting domain-containing protein [Bacteroidota bacterium]
MLHSRDFRIRTERRISHLTAILWVVASYSLLAQPADVKLSIEPRQPFCPREARIQAAAGTHGITLVAWGSSASDGDTIRPVLYVQIVRDTIPQGMPALLTTPDARPSGYVAVVPLRDRFVVVWQDEREPGGVLYCRTVDTTGRLGAYEEFLDTALTIPPGVTAITTTTGYRLIWPTRRADARAHARDLDSMGHVRGTAFATMLHNVLRIVPLAAHPGTAIADCGRDGLIVLDSTGGIRDTIETFNRVISIRDDGAMLECHGSLVRMYASPIDSVAIRVLRQPPPIQPGHQGTVAMWDSSAHARIFDLRHVARQNFFGESEIGVEVTAVVETSLDTFKDLGVIVFALEMQLPHGFLGDFSLGDPTLTRPCAEVIRFALPVKLESQNPDDPAHTVHSSQSVNTIYLGPNGVVQNAECSGVAAQSPAVRRLENPLYSEVMLGQGAPVVHLKAPLGMARVNVPQTSPVIAQEGNELLVGWTSQGIDSVAALGRWTVSGASRCDMVDAYHASQDGSDSAPAPHHTLFTTTYGGGTCALLTAAAVSGEQVAQVIRGTAQGWRSVQVVETPTSAVPGEPVLTGSGLQRDPNTGTLVSAIGLTGQSGAPEDRQYRTLWLAGLDASGNRSWVIDSMTILPGLYVSAIPCADHSFAAGSSSDATRYNDTARTSSRHIADWSEPARYRRLLGPWLLRWITTGNELYVARYDTVLADAGSVHIPLPGAVTNVNVDDATVVQNPRDSGFAFVTAGTSGVWVCTFDRELRLLRDSIPVSLYRGPTARPAGVIRNDTLFVVWEDYRNNQADIYGAMIPLHRRTGSIATESLNTDNANTATVFPNPANDVATLRFSHPLLHPATLRLVDLLGRVVMEISSDAGTSVVSITTGELSTGQYLVIGGSSGPVARLFVAH